jgi:hypothetical protein
VRDDSAAIRPPSSSTQVDGQDHAACDDDERSSSSGVRAPPPSSAPSSRQWPSVDDRDHQGAIVLYAVHGGTHLLRYFGLYYGGETPIPTRPRYFELRDVPLLVALAGILLFYPSPSR